MASTSAYSLDSLSPRAYRALLCFLDPTDGKPHPELLILEKEALDWFWRHSYLFSLETFKSVLALTPQSEVPSLYSAACNSIMYLSIEELSSVISLASLSLYDPPKELRPLNEILSFSASQGHPRHVDENMEMAKEVYIKKTFSALLFRVFSLQGFYPKTLDVKVIQTLYANSLDYPPLLVQTAKRRDLSSEALRLLQNHPASAIRGALVETQMSLSIPPPFPFFYTLLGDEEAYIAEQARTFFLRTGSRLDSLIGILLPGSPNWLVSRRKIVKDGYSHAFTTNPKPFFEIPNDYMKNDILTVLEDKDSFELISGSAAGAMLPLYELKPCRDNSLLILPSITDNYPPPEQPVLVHLKLEARVGNRYYALWENSQEVIQGWTKEPLKNSLPLKTPKTIPPSAWLSSSPDLKSLEAYARSLISNQIAL